MPGQCACWKASGRARLRPRRSALKKCFSPPHNQIAYFLYKRIYKVIENYKKSCVDNGKPMDGRIRHYIKPGGRVGVAIPIIIMGWRRGMAGSSISQILPHFFRTEPRHVCTRRSQCLHTRISLCLHADLPRFAGGIGTVGVDRVKVFSPNVFRVIQCISPAFLSPCLLTHYCSNILSRVSRVSEPSPAFSRILSASCRLES